MLKKIPAPELGPDAVHYVPEDWTTPEPRPTDEDLARFRDAWNRLTEALNEDGLAKRIMQSIHGSGASKLPRLALQHREEYPSPIDSHYKVDEQIAMTWLLHAIVLTPRRPGADPVRLLIDLIRSAA